MTKTKRSKSSSAKKREKKQPSILHLNLHREFFDAIATRKKRIEYRDQSPFWRKRLEGRKYDLIQFRNGYATKAPVIQVQLKGIRRNGNRRSGQYALSLGRVLWIKRWKRRLE